MNNLSWFIYLADVLPKAAFIAGVISTFFLVLGVIVSIIYIIDMEKLHKSMALLLVPFMLVFVALAIPSKETIYAIAASEMGETIVKSEEGQQVLKALKDWTLAQLSEKK